MSTRRVRISRIALLRALTSIAHTPSTTTGPLAVAVVGDMDTGEPGRRSGAVADRFVDAAGRDLVGDQGGGIDMA